ncbi:MAG: cytochrome c [Microbacteriaceae bacterium]|nr:cytochrome c [Microbacteriaceae bacterium]
MLISFLMFLLFGCGQNSQHEPPQPASVQAIAEGNVENGRKLFMGYKHFENEGPPCMGCHNLGDYGILGGGALGPDLTNVSSERSDIELASVLSNNRWTKSPVMEPIYNQHPLTESEQADLIAFMKSSAGEPQADKEWLVLGISILATIGAAIVIGFVYRNRLRRIRATMVEEAEKELL